MGTNRSIARTSCISLIAAVVVLCLVPAAASAASAGGYSVRPGDFDPKDPATRAYFKPVLKPGATRNEHVVVTNLGATPLSLLVDPVDGLTGRTSGAVYANRQDPVTKAGSWVIPSRRTLTLPPHASVSVAFTIHVPADATAGDHLAGIAFQNTATSSSGNTFAVKEIIREVVGIQIRVPGAASTHLQIGALAVQSLPGTAFASVVVNLTNDGGLLCKPSLDVVLDGPSGAARTVTRQLDTILPGDTIAYPVPWPDHLASGKYVARASAQRCGPSVATGDTTIQLGVPLNGSAERAPQRATRAGISVWTLLAVVAGAILAGLLIGLTRRRHEEEPVPATTFTPVSADFARFVDAQLEPARTRVAPFESSAGTPQANGHGRSVDTSEPATPPPPRNETASPSQQTLWP